MIQEVLFTELFMMVSNTRQFLRRQIKNRIELLLCLVCCSLISSCGQKDKKEHQEPSGVPEEKVVVKVDIPAEIMSSGKAVYDQYCLVCHQADGSGVPGLNAPLIESDYVQGDKEPYLTILLKGSLDGPSLNNGAYANNMPGFVQLKDQELADLASYVRNSFDNTGELITPEEVAEIRNKKD
ncbi:c-type cytochrome [Poritiphilus flavus]|uniref:C-type cytochrome n=1 Tax=Poritiphilus flavus TaxID=2697053 RepID=A0A6L9EDY4_9FLAO|nr:cytochrome c [Poritiphilus flavus]NAS12916.1 c-type cytochrome [Poritiphilus flavus]